MIQDYSKAPRLYVPEDLAVGGVLPLSKDHTHYLTTVMRKGDGDPVRIFNGRDGEFVGFLTTVSKKAAILSDLEKIKAQDTQAHRTHLYFAPIKKDRMAFLIEKAVELGVTDLHPVITDRTQHANKINPYKMLRHIIEASEQCERMDIPTLHATTPLDKTTFITPSFAALERQDCQLFTLKTKRDCGVIIGPEGGWSEAEIAILSDHDAITPVSLGDRILRAETAAIFMLSRIG